jgi:mannitol 2-dehydrogenase|tara:strand:+ start:219 stop:1685 length:1467 start_codon:yes stop_codon:yes gene_type:complete
MRLSNATLSKLPPEVLRPIYDREKLTAGIVHIGLGNFHRAHQAWYLHRLMQKGLALDWAIIGAGVRPYDAVMRDRLIAQDCLTTLIELDPASSSAEVIGGMIDYLPIEDGNASLILRMAQKDIRIVSITVTEGGYFIDPATNRFDAHHPEIIHDAVNPEKPKTAFGAIVAALRLRRNNGSGPLTGLCCDNLQGNGDIFRQVVVSLARMSDPELANWIDVNCTFPNSMVDCIVPTTGSNEIALTKEIGIEDQVPVTHENFRQWVVEDDFCAGRPDWEKVGVQCIGAVHDFELMKLRILNGGHQVVSVPAEVLSLKTIASSMQHPLISGLFQKVALTEIAPNVKAVPGMTPEDYVNLIHNRFMNPKIIDTIRRVAFDGSSRHPCFIVPSIRDGLAVGTPIEGLALVEAAWARMCEGERENQTTIEPNDPFWNELQTKAREARLTPGVWLEMRQFYGDLADEPRFADSFVSWLEMIWSEGLEKAISTYLDG